MVKRSGRGPATDNSSPAPATAIARSRASGQRQRRDTVSPSGPSLLLSKRVLPSANRQELETEDVYDVLSVASNSPSAISISSGGDAEQEISGTVSASASQPRKRNGGVAKSRAPTTANSRSAPSSNGALELTRKRKVPTAYAQMLNEIVGDEVSDDEDDVDDTLPRGRKRPSHPASTARSPNRKTPKIKTDTPGWGPKGKGKARESAIEIDSDSGSAGDSAQGPRLMAPISSESAAYLASSFAGMSDDDSDDEKDGTGNEAHASSSNNKSGQSGSAEDDDMDDGDDSDDDMEWENVEIDVPPLDSAAPASEEPAQEIKAVEFTIGETTPTRSKRKKPTITKEDREQRMLTHMLHLVCLICHGSTRSRWCNDASVKDTVSKFVPDGIEDELKPDPTLPVTQRTRKFLDGLRHLMEFWNRRYHIVYKGIRKRTYEELENIKKEKGNEPALELSDFRRSLARLEGSRDLGAQGFCALLRAFRVRTRLVFSLQPLPFTFSTKSAQTKASRASKAIRMDLNDERSSDFDSESSVPKRPPVRLRKPRLGTPTLTYTTNDYESSQFDEAPYPVFWVEAWDEAGLQWVSVDPMVLKLVEIPRSKSKFEPPQSEARNVLSYAIAFDQAGHAKDVTRRYAQYYNAKTRKLRITNEPSGQIWFDQMLRCFQTDYLTSIDQMEDAALLKKELSEDIPNNIQDFRGHPVYVLERHLHKNEIIHPKVACGTIAVGRSKNSETEPIYRRRDVQTLRSAMQWYKIGRVVKVGEQPLKHTKKRTLPKSRSAMLDSDYEDGAGEEEDEEVALYAHIQTDIYVPPPVLNGKIPRNDYGNLDVFVPSMVPKGAVHLRQRGIANAVKVLEIDYADAVGGFDFQNRKATPRLDGIVVAEEYEEAVMAVYRAQQEQLEFEADQKKLNLALERWRRYLKALRIKERLAHNPGFKDLHQKEKEQAEENEAKGREQVGEEVAPNEPNEERDTIPDNGDDDSDGGGFIADDTDQRAEDDDDDGGGGFIAGDDAEDDGGFAPDMDDYDFDEGDEGLYD
ncbi:hypothetical protein BZA70DRAFT_30961 [Myxozyma melibiosi]|uniref:Rad4-domain-containing protein n=1 Tax=Myxozyma melibiosi TaxID=54550 RepID=A0ABR1FDY7_9ASCO